MRGGGVEKLVLEGKIKGRRQRVREGIKNMESLAEEVGRGVEEMLKRVGET